MASAGTPAANKKRRFKGWVCEDEIDGDQSLQQEVARKGRSFATPERGLEKESPAPKPASSAPAKAINKAIPKSVSNTISKVVSTADPSPLIKQTPRPVGRPRKHPASTEPKPARKRVEPPLPTPTPKKKRRFTGWVCDDELSDQDKKIKDVIEHRGKSFKEKEQGKDTDSESESESESESDSETETDPDQSVVTSKTASSAPRRHPTNPVHNGAAPKGKTTNSSSLVPNGVVPKTVTEPLKKAANAVTEPIKKTAASTLSAYGIDASRIDPSLRDISPAHAPPPSSSSLATTPAGSSKRPPAAQNPSATVAELTKLARERQKEADDLKKRHAAAERKAKDALNSLEEAKRAERRESMKESAREKGLKYHPGWSWEDNGQEASSQQQQGKGKAGAVVSAERSTA